MAQNHGRGATEDPRWLRLTVVGIVLAFIFLLLVLPLATVFTEALRRGLAPALAAIADPDGVAAIRLTLITAAIAVPFNAVFGICASWAIAKHQFPGKSLLITLIDLPFSVSPVVAGLIYVLVFGLQGWLGPWLQAHGIQIIFALPGIVLATIFVTFPFIARELIPLMQAQGVDEEEAAVSLGAGGVRTFLRVTAPNIRWGLLYGLLLCNARAMGEFGAVSVVSGHIRGETDTMPLHVEILYNEYNFVGAFAVAGLLCLLAVLTIVVKTALEALQPEIGRVATDPANTAPEGAVLTDRPDRNAPLTIAIQAVTKRFARYPALKGVDLEVRPGELLALLGPSGSGKTTLLRVIAGLEFPDGGSVLFDGEDVTYAGASHRGVGFVFQQYALFKHMTVARNVAFGLEVRKKNKPSKAERDARVAELLELVELGGYGKRYPTQLSGGQRQRVALARALAVSPRVLLLDEPFGALDATVRKSLRRELRRIHDATGLTTVFVTHDQEEALELADRVAVLNKGEIEQVGAPHEVHDDPASAFVAGFVGEANRLDGEVRDGRFHVDGVSFATEAPQGPATGYVRLHQLVLADEGEPGLPARVERVVFNGPMARLECVGDGGRALEAGASRERALPLRPGAAVSLALRGGHVFPRG